MGILALLRAACISTVILAQMELAEGTDIQFCRAPVHDKLRAYYLRAETAVVCIRYKNASSASPENGHGASSDGASLPPSNPLDVALSCGRQSNGLPQLKLQLEGGSNDCTGQIDGRDLACDLQGKFGHWNHLGLRLTGQKGEVVNVDGLDRIYATHGSDICAEFYGGDLEVPETHIARCFLGQWQSTIPDVVFRTKSAYSCDVITASVGR